ncbi:MAG: hypothetical protein ATN34_03620 [Epulopiscium sp. Nele67-Bin002]|nr:MAG: hypothetical protein BEN18_10600 [Epulopiscium sp. Nuni2H_MBin001]OON91259.1 MAG: hypothetical protein ATN34_03620 [Epulopiscium sp. Nele67-Bin002]
MDLTYYEIQELIKQKKYTKANYSLQQIKERNAVWHYLSSLIAYKREWFDAAKRHIKQAVELDNTNDIYKKFYVKLMGPHGGPPPGHRPPPPPNYRQPGCCCGCCDDGCCKVNCCHLICADSCCECMGGDLISCI